MSDPYPQGKLQRSEFGTLLPNVLQQIIKPTLAQLIGSNEKITNKSSLHTAFKSATESTVSFSTFTIWLEVLGISFRKVVQIDGVSPAPAPGGTVGSPPAAGGTEETEVAFNNETPADFRTPRGFGDAFSEIARLTGEYS